ncbi:MAG: DUF1801 domain-containing protein [Bacteroidetes bacterium]|nr:DUF1801 domain-containing protein [Bacteroidota bacterium]
MNSLVQQYFDQLTDPHREYMESIRAIIKTTAPDATEVFSYQMPGFKLNGSLIWYACFKDHYAIYMPPKYLAPFENALRKFGRTKSAVKFDYNTEPPLELIASLVEAGAAYNRENLPKKSGNKVKK